MHYRLRTAEGLTSGEAGVFCELTAALSQSRPATRSDHFICAVSARSSEPASTAHNDLL